MTIKTRVMAAENSALPLQEYISLNKQYNHNNKIINCTIFDNMTVLMYL